MKLCYHLKRPAPRRKPFRRDLRDGKTMWRSGHVRIAHDVPMDAPRPRPVARPLSVDLPFLAMLARFRGRH